MRFVSVYRRIDHPTTVADREVINAEIVQFVWNAGPSNSPAGVFDNALAFTKRTRGEDAAAVNT